MTSYIKDPAAKLDYGKRWDAWLAAGETIASHAVTADTGITVGTTSHTDSVVTAWLTGGTAGTDYKVTLHIATNQGREDERTITIKVRDR